MKFSIAAIRRCLLVTWLLFGTVMCQLRDYPDFSHRAVKENAAQEAQLPPSLLNPFYKNPRIRSALAKSSWFGPGEMPVFQREADKATRRDIYAILNHAGLLRS